MTVLVSLHSFRHGTGKTSLVANMAVMLAHRGFRVGIMDTDWQAPGIHLLFGHKEGEIDTKFDQLVQENPLLQQTDWDPLLDFRANNLHGSVVLIPNSSNATTKDITGLLRNGLDVVELSHQLHYEIEPLHLDYVLIDSHPGFDEGSLFLMTLADLVVIVISLDQQDLQGAAVLVDLAHYLDIHQMQMVGNQIPAHLQPEQVLETLQSTYGIPVVGLLPFSEDILELAGQGIFCLHYPDHPFSRKVEAIVESIVYSGLASSLGHSSESTQFPMPSSDLDLTPSSESPPEGLKMSQMILLPPIQRRLLNWLLRQTDGATLKDFSDYLEQPTEEIQSVLDELVDQNYLKILEETVPVRYKANLAPKSPPQRRSGKMWSALGDVD
ncbi:MAG: MinD/ParA family protein [Cyanophyceae cyanobacterium]